MPITADEYKGLMRHWATGVTIITTLGPEGPHGMTANSFTGVSLDPPLVLVCVARHTHTHELLKEGVIFGIHILHWSQEELSNRCAGLQGEAGHLLADLPHHTGPCGAILLDDCLAALECRVQAAHDGGDHTIFVGEVLSTRVPSGPGEGAPLLYFNRGYRPLK